jgi:DNA-dependent RNA polymerase auxiliary subunit epsilon
MKNVIYLKWKDKKLVLNECTPQNLIEHLSEENMKVSFSESISDEDLDYIKTELKIDIENSVNSWINDSRFVFHLLISAGVFLVSYYFFSYVIRDPLPLVDEIVLSLLIAGFSWYRLKNQQYKSDTVIHKKVEIEQYLADIPYNSSDFLVQVELYLEKLASMNDMEQKN